MTAHRQITHDLDFDDLPVGGYSWLDAQGNPISDELEEFATAPIAGVQVCLKDAAGVEVARTMTDVRGGYHFEDLPVGDYTVVFIAPSDEATAPGSMTSNRETGGTSTTNDVSVDVHLDHGLLPTPIQTWTGALPFGRAGSGRGPGVLSVAGTLG
jgi:hypothetical protein